MRWSRRDETPSSLALTLPEAIRAGILAMVKAAGGTVDCKGELDTGSLVTSLTAATCEG